MGDIEKRIKGKIEEAGIPLNKWGVSINRGIVTGLNEAFILSGAKKNDLIRIEPKSAEIIRPILRGRDIKRYGYEYSDLYLICTFPSKNYDIEDFPAIKNHLLSFGYDRLEQSGKSINVYGKSISARKKTNNKWFETQDSISYWDDFSKQKIMYPNMTKYLPFYLDDKGFFQNDKSFFITGSNLSFLCAFLNSSLFKYCFINNFPELQGGTRELRKIFFDKIPVIQIQDSENEIYKELVEEIQRKKEDGKETENIEREIDDLIFNLYNLNNVERKAIGYIIIQ
jgi:hypothetical protein